MFNPSFVYLINTNMLSVSSVLLAVMLRAIGKEKKFLFTVLVFGRQYTKYTSCLFISGRFFMSLLLHTNLWRALLRYIQC